MCVSSKHRLHLKKFLKWKRNYIKCVHTFSLMVKCKCSACLQDDASRFSLVIICHRFSRERNKCKSIEPQSSSSSRRRVSPAEPSFISCLIHFNAIAEDTLWKWLQSVRWHAFFSIWTSSEFTSWTRQNWTEIFLQHSRHSTVLRETWWLLTCTEFMINTARSIIINNRT